MNRPLITIIGAGVSGLVAAIELEKAGFSTTIIEQSDGLGGRVRTEYLDNIPFDRGFQVLLTEYPEAKRYLDYEALDLVKFLPGSIIFKDKKQEKIGDPLRDASFLWPTTFASIGTINDKRKVLQLSLELKKKSIEAIFTTKEVSTLEYLKNYGFSAAMIEDFFRPFFAGIFLEKELHTSSRMFEFVYKMFGTGYAAIPKRGMQAIPEQLASQLKDTSFMFNTKINNIKGDKLYVENGEVLNSDYTIIATPADNILNIKRDTDSFWKSCYNLYFSVSEKTKSFDDPIIALLPEKDTLVNNFHFLNDVFSTSSDQKILSVTVVGDQKTSAASLVAGVKKELKTFCDIEVDELLQLFHVRKALPNICDLKYTSDASNISPVDNIFLCGDHLANSSLNAAMASGRGAAEALIKKINTLS